MRKPIRNAIALREAQAIKLNARGLAILSNAPATSLRKSDAGATPTGCSQKDLAYATALFTRAIYLVPSEPSYYIHRAEALLKVDDFESAIANYKKGASLINNNAERRPDLSHAAETLHLAHTARTNTGSQSASTPRTVTSNGLGPSDRLTSAPDSNAPMTPSKNSDVNAPSSGKQSTHSSNTTRPQTVKSASNPSSKDQLSKNSSNRSTKPGTAEANVQFSEADAEAGPPYSFWLERRLRRVLFTWGQILLDQRRFKEALVMFKEAKKLDINLDSVLLRMAAAHIGLQQFDEAFELLYTLTSRNQNNADLFILRAKLYRSLGNPDFVNVDLQRAIQIDPSHPDIMSLLEFVVLAATKYKNLASEQIVTGEYELAIYFLNLALELDPHDWISLFKRGILFHQIGHNESSVSDLMAVLVEPCRDTERDQEVKIHLASVHNKIGVEYFQAQRYELAVNEFSTAITFNPIESTMFKNRADCYEALGDISNQRQDLKAALDLEPYDEDCIKRLSLLYLAIAEQHISAGEYNAALIELTRAIQVDPNQAQCRFERARTLHILARIDEARDELANVIKLSPGHHDAIALLAQITPGKPLDPLQPFPPQKLVARGPTETTGKPRTLVDNAEMPLPSLLYHFPDEGTSVQIDPNYILAKLDPNPPVSASSQSRSASKLSKHSLAPAVVEPQKSVKILDLTFPQLKLT
ncbi:Tetratricopeptide repeat protein 16 [Blyttiomyces sp. JEL0837]|nr:Tetratricopeptide repeat protein 16 [Blyttiomyces sp. JEL0837]